jgi:hypothetical protein
VSGPPSEHACPDRYDLSYTPTEKRGYRVWYDQLAKNLTVDGMKEGIAKSKNFVLFLSKGVAAREYVQLELRHAIELKKSILLCHEEDERHGASACTPLVRLICINQQANTTSGNGGPKRPTT